MIKLILQVSHIPGFSLATPWENKVIASLEQLNIQVEIHPVAIQNPHGGLTDGQLHTILHKTDQPLKGQAISSGDWYINLLMVNSHQNASFLGLMFDNLGERRREGCAVFINPIQNNFDNSKFMEVCARTAIHEIGHAFNFCHPGTLNQDRSVMLQSGRARTKTNWLQAGSFEYSQNDKNSFFFQKDNTSKPGNKIPFVCSVNSDLAYIVRKKKLNKDLQIDLTIVEAFEDGRIELGEPLEVLVTIKNVSAKNLSIYEPQGFVNQNMELIVESENEGTRSVIKGPMLACTDGSDVITLKPSDVRTSNGKISWSSDGFIFKRIGGYKIYVALKSASQEDYWYISTPCSFEIVRSKNEDLLNFLFKKRFGIYKYLEGPLQMTYTTSEIKKLLISFPKNPILLESLGESYLTQLKYSQNTRAIKKKCLIAIEILSSFLSLDEMPEIRKERVNHQIEIIQNIGEEWN